MTLPTTVGGLCNQAGAHLLGRQREMLNQLDGAFAAGAATATLKYPTDDITVGSRLGIGAEVVYVWSKATSAQQVTVERGMDGTTDESHSDLDLVEVDWRFFTAQVRDALVHEILSWPQDIFQVRTKDVTIVDGTDKYSLDLTGFRHKLRVRRSVTGRDTWPEVNYDVEDGLNTTTFSPDGIAMFLREQKYGDGTARLEYAADFDLSTVDLTTTLSTIGLSDQLIDAAEYGIVWRLLAGQETPRSDMGAQPEPRIAEEVGERAALQSASAFLALREQRLKDESNRLRRKYGGLSFS